MTLVAGFLGSGKTTLVNHVLQEAASQTSGPRLGVVVNDFGSIEVDADLIVGVRDEVLTLSNGCICCTLRSGISDCILQLSERSPHLDHVVVEASGVADPGPLLDIFRELQRAALIRFDGLVTVVDAERFPLPDEDLQALQVRQVRAADLVVLNKIDLAADLEPVKAALRAISPDAHMVEAQEGRVDLDVILGLSLGLDEFPSWVSTPALGQVDDSPASALHAQLSHFTWEHIPPIPYRPFFDALKALPEDVLRAKGFLSLVERPGVRVVAHLVGRRLYAQPHSHWGEEAPCSRLVFIGRFTEADVEAMKSRLNAAALGEDGPAMGRSDH
ncbi:MAG: CobW family GTP-binding protein [Myxococcota bacterium]